MRKLIAISFLTLHLFSLAAALVVHAIAVYRSDRFFERQIDRGLYNIHDLTEIRIPTNAPRKTEWRNYESTCGAVMFAHNAYNYVAMKVTKGAIYLLCVPNYKTTHLCRNNIIDARMIPDIPVSKKDHVPFEKAVNLSVFHYYHTEYCFCTPVLAITTSPGDTAAQVTKPAIRTAGQPPEIC
jgi:hypothetical protein